MNKLHPIHCKDDANVCFEGMPHAHTFPSPLPYSGGIAEAIVEVN